MAELEPELGDLDSLLMSLVSEEGPPRTDDSETIRVDDLLVDESGLPLALDVETRKAPACPRTLALALTLPLSRRAPQAWISRRPPLPRPRDRL